MLLEEHDRGEIRELQVGRKEKEHEIMELREEIRGLRVGIKEKEQELRELKEEIRGVVNMIATPSETEVTKALQQFLLKDN